MSYVFTIKYVRCENLSKNNMFQQKSLFSLYNILQCKNAFGKHKKQIKAPDLQRLS